MAKYNPNYHPAKAQELLSLRGLTDVELAAAFCIAKSTLYLWRNRHADFAAAMDAGKVPANEAVEGAVFKRAVGYTYEEIHEESEYIGRKLTIVKRKRITKHVPGDVRAQEFYLRNRDRMHWGDTAGETGKGDTNDTLKNFVDALSGTVDDVWDGESAPEAPEDAGETESDQ